MRYNYFMLETIRNNKKLRKQTTHVIVALILIIIAQFFLSEYETIAMILWGIAFIVGGYYKAVEGYVKTIESKALNVEFLMILAALAAFITQDYREGAVLIFIFAFSGVLEEYANTKSEKALTSLLELSPKTAVKVQDDEEVVVNVDELTIGDVLVVKVGQYIPADGKIIKGAASINESAITGEFVPVSKTVDDIVFAGSLNEDSTIYIRVEKNPKDSTMQKIVDFVMEAQESQTKSQTFIERFERWYVYVVIALAFLFMLVPYLMGWLNWHEAFYRGVIVLVVGSPCAVVASITPAILSSLSYGANHGILIKGGEHLESLKNVDTIVFDKTGTITSGKPRVVEFVVSDDVDKDWLVQIVVSIEKESNHPLAKAIAMHYESIDTLDVSTKEISGNGMECNHKGKTIQVGRFDNKDPHGLRNAQQKHVDNGETLVEITVDGVLVGYVSLIDTIRDDAKSVIQQLNDMNIETIMLTGDQEHTALAIAKQIGVSRVESECLPTDKSDIVQEIKSSEHVVMMIGDGINDAPSLAIANVGAAMGDATDVSLETADVVFINNNLNNIISLLKLSKKASKIINQNLVFSIIVIISLLISNVFGIVILTHGVIAHEGSTILVILNSLRLLRN